MGHCSGASSTSFSPYLPAPMLTTIPKQTPLSRRHDSLPPSKLGVTAELSPLRLLLYLPLNLGQILKSKEGPSIVQQQSPVR